MISDNIRHFFSGIRELISTMPARTSREIEMKNLYARAFSHARAVVQGGQAPMITRGEGNYFGCRASYSPAANKSRVRDDWASSIKSLTSLIIDEWETIVSRSELAMRTDAYAKAARNILLDHIVGSGLRPFPAVKDGNGKMVDSINKALSDDWKRFNDQGVRTGNNPMTLYESQRLRLGTIIDTGAVLTNIVQSKQGSHLPIAFQFLKPTRLKMEYDDNYTEDNETIKAVKRIHGMEINDYGEVTGFRLNGYDGIIPANKMMINFYQQECEQYMGLPWLTPVLPFFWDLQNLLQDRMLASRLVEKVALWIKKTSKKTLMQAQDSDDEIPWESATILSTGDKPELIQSQDRVSETFAPLVRLYLHGIGAGLGFSYHLLTRDLEGVNFSSTRFNTIKDNKYFQSLYKWFVKGPCANDWNQFVKWEFLTSKIHNYGVAQYNRDPWYYSQVYWLPEGEDWIDPLKDAQALKISYESGWLTLQEICQLKGKDWHAILKQRSIEKSTIKELGLDDILSQDQVMIEAQKETEKETEDA